MSHIAVRGTGILTEEGVRLTDAGDDLVAAATRSAVAGSFS